MKHTPKKPLIERTIVTKKWKPAMDDSGNENRRRDFRATIEDFASEDAASGFEAFVTNRHWHWRDLNQVKGAYEKPRLFKDGVDLDSARGREKDPASWLARRLPQQFRTLAVCLEKASKETMDAAMTAFDTALDYAEFLHHAKSKGGMSKGRAGITPRRREALAKADAKWRNLPASERKRKTPWDFVPQELHPKSASTMATVLSDFRRGRL